MLTTYKKDIYRLYLQFQVSMPQLTNDKQLKSQREVLNTVLARLRHLKSVDSVAEKYTLLVGLPEGIEQINVGIVEDTQEFVEEYLFAIAANVVISHKEQGKNKLVEDFVMACLRKIVDVYLNRTKDAESLAPIVKVLNKKSFIFYKVQVKSTFGGWGNSSSDKDSTPFYHQCVANVLKELNKHPKIVWEVSVRQTSDLVNFINTLQPNPLHTKEAYELIENLLAEILAFFKSGRPEILKNHSTTILKTLEENLIRKTDKTSMIKSIYELSLHLAETFLRGQTAEQRKAGFFLFQTCIDKFSYDRIYSRYKEHELKAWLNEHEIYEYVFSMPAVCEEYIDKYGSFFRYIQRAKTYYQKTAIILSLLKKNPQGDKLNKFIYKEIDVYYLDSKSKELLYEYFTTVEDWTKIPAQFFDIIGELPAKAEDAFVEKIFNLVVKMFVSSFEKWTDNYRTKATSLLRSTFSKFQSAIRTRSADYRQKWTKDSMIDLLSNLSIVNIIIFNHVFVEGQLWKCYSNTPFQHLFSEIADRYNFFSQVFKLLENTVTTKSTQREFVKIIKFASSKTVTKSDITFKYIQVISKFPEIFEELLGNESYAQIDDQMKKVIAIFKANPETPFHIFTLTFQKINHSYFSDYNRQYSLLFEKKEDKTLNLPPKKLKFYEQIMELLLETGSADLRVKLCQYIFSLYCGYKSSKAYTHEQSGEECFLTFTGELIDNLILDYSQYRVKPTTKNVLTVSLQLIEKSLEFTDILGCGIYKPHKSLVSTSTIFLTIINNVTFGDDVQKSIHRDFPSNMTLFDALTIAGLSFKCGPENIVLKQNGRFIPPIYNSRSLQDLHLTHQDLIAEQNLANRLKIPEIVQSNASRQLRPEIISVITDVFNRFAFQGKMSILQCTNYVRQASGSDCLSSDRRVKQIFDFDKDNDNIITLNDFIEYYKKNFTASMQYHRDLALKGLFNLRYRKNLTFYTVPLDISQQYYIMTRYKIAKNHQNLYDILFQLAREKDQQLSEKAKHLLLYLPSNLSLKNQVSKEINFNACTEFQIYYKLILIQSELNADESQESRKQRISLFLQNKNSEIIFMLLSNYHSKPNKSQYQQKSMLICLRILRSLINIGYLSKTSIKDTSFDQSAIPILPPTTFFAEQSIIAFNSRNIINFQTLLVLQLTQTAVDLQPIINCCFNPEEEIRKIACNFLYYWSIKTNFSINLFAVTIPQHYNQEWFDLLCGIIRMDQSLDIKQLKQTSISILSSRQQTFHNHYDYLMNGYLKILSAVAYRDKTVSPQMQLTFQHLLRHSISVKNRTLIFQIILDLNRQLLYTYFQQMLSTILPSQQCQIRQLYMGLKNLGAICYINSILQQFFMIDKFKHMILSRNVPSGCKEVEVAGRVVVDDFMYQLQRVYHNLEYSQKKYFVPKDFCYSYKNFQGEPINTSIQEDAHEFLNRMVENAEEAFKKQDKLSQFQEIFTIKKLTEISCEQCGNRIQKYEKDYCLMIEVKNHDNLEDSLKKFTEKEEVADYFCEKCNKKVSKIGKRTYLNQLPEIVVLNLQRIIYDPYKGDKVKVHTKLSFPQVLNFQDYIKNDNSAIHTQYSLKGVVIHTGTSEGGHYYSLIKTKKYGWLKFNDQNVTSFDEKDIQRQCFGGFEAKDGWAEVSYSTNAYILFYERSVLPSHEFIQAQNKFTVELHKQNSKLINQLQIHQETFFKAIIASYEKVRYPNFDELVRVRPFLEENLNPALRKEYQQLFNIIKMAFGFLTIYSDIKQDIRVRIGQIFNELIYTLPDTTLSFLKDCNIRTYAQNIISNSTNNQRETLKQTLVTVIVVHCRYYGLNLSVPSESNNFIFQIFSALLSCMQNTFFYSNITKISSYLSLFIELMKHVEGARIYLLQDHYLFRMLDLIMGKESAFLKYHPHAQDLPVNILPLVYESIDMLLGYKFNLKGQPILKHSIMQTTSLQAAILTSPTFQKRIIRLKYDHPSLSNILTHYSYNDLEYSAIAAEFIMHNLNNRDQLPDLANFFRHVRNFLMIKDELQTVRFGWILGVPQYKQVGKEEYCLEYSDRTDYLRYVPGINFKKATIDHARRSLLEIAAEKIFMNAVAGIYSLKIILQLALQSDRAFQYLISIPPMNYLIKSYFDWIPAYLATTMKDNDIIFQRRNETFTEMMNMLDIIIPRVKQCGDKLPVQKVIIGKTKIVLRVQSTQNTFINAGLDRYTTYVLENKPNGDDNESMPRKFFLSQDPRGIAHVFIKHRSKYNYQSEAKDVKYMSTFYTISGVAKQRLIIRFKGERFHHRIILNEGDFSLNFPFEKQGQILDLMSIEPFLEYKSNPKPQEISLLFKVQQKKMEMQQQQQKKEFNPAGPAGAFIQPKIKCGTCTYDNEITSQRCEMCDNPLFN